ncbi:hypothetical protein BDK92_4848 [Micromonospora pisi]|uniref:Lipoprotein n=1 Tax=Micromonospora pisi TaxID=589240 RepID=A0A495JPB0_9ACTN|nr:hypothetical protein [Micromonospora pisi]RKR90475.1 hypothetical protein BDK92_4848 [Micromonospora pisi]
MTYGHPRRTLPLLLLAALLTLTGCTGVGVAGAPDSGSGSYQVWGLNEASSALTGDDRSVVLNGDLDNDSKPFFTAEGTWGAAGFTLDEASAERARDLTGKLPERTGDPDCVRLVLVDGRLLGDRAVATIAAGDVLESGPVVAIPLE